MKEHYDKLFDNIGRTPTIPLCPSCLRGLEVTMNPTLFGCQSCEVVMKKEAVLWGHHDRKYLARDWNKVEQK